MRHQGWAFLSCAIWSFSGLASGQTAFYHEDGRPKLQFDLAEQKLLTGTSEEVANHFLKENHATYGLPASLVNLRLRSVKSSLLANRYHFQQTYDGIDIFGAEIVVSVAKSDNKVIQVYSTLFAGEMPALPLQNVISADEAYDIVWKDLGVSERLLSAPEAKLVYKVTEGKLALTYAVKLAVQEPFGTWRYFVQAISGAILQKEDMNHYRRPKNIPAKLGPTPILDRKTAFATFFAKQKARLAPDEGTPANGSGLVFNPDPRTALKDNSLEDKDDDDRFEAAYENASLFDITNNGSEWLLIGPWVQIVDFDRPDTEPSTSKDGIWDAKRGNNAFNDVMTYFHIDMNQRYMQSLGFKDETGIQFRSIPADADGVNGSDNSYFSPSDNRIAFGHGCVDDNEDADVILHEYGHAIQFSINENWEGGDTGAMGEGFGDYWAGSYSISTENGAEFNPEEVFTWDGHGDNDSCWSGRILNAHAAKYDPKRSYSAHVSIPGGFQSDELWSTPLFQTLLAGLEQGLKREDFDRIVLESHFGLGYGLSMREMARATVETAKRLHPKGPHHELFEENFKKHKILE